MTKSTAVVPSSRLCPMCGSEPKRIVSLQPALFFHAGYGASLEVVTELCLSCRKSREKERNSVSPRL